MQTQIKKLIGLAEQFYKLGEELNLPQTHNYLNERGETSVKVYFNNNYETKAFFLDKVEISDYANRIAFPFDATEDYLEKMYIYGLSFLKKFTDEKKAEILKASELEIIETIARLEKELSNLKQSL